MEVLMSLLGVLTSFYLLIGVSSVVYLAYTKSVFRKELYTNPLSNHNALKGYLLVFLCALIAIILWPIMWRLYL